MTAQADGCGKRLRAVVSSPTARPLGWGVVVALGLIVVETGLVLLLRHRVAGDSYVAAYLVGVLVAAAGWNFGLALATAAVSGAVYASLHVAQADQLIASLSVFMSVVVLAGVLASEARVRAAESEQRRREAVAQVSQQTALRRVATLVARGAEPAAVYRVAVTELARGLAVDHVALVEFDASDQALVLAVRDLPDRAKLAVGERLPPDGASLSARIRATGERVRIDDYQLVDGDDAVRMRDMGLRCGVGAPVTVDGVTRGALVVGSARIDSLPSETESCISDFAELVAVAIGNVDTGAQLRASRARIVAAADEARRGIERELHDGAQQRIASLGLGLRTLEATIPPDQQALRKQVDNLVVGMADLYVEVQELSRGIYPATLSKGGLGPALKTLARRSAVPVVLHLDVDGRLPESIELAAYYVVTEALANAAKHARATGVTIRAGFDDGDLRLDVTDDGIGGATTGSGLTALADRVDTVSGRLVVTSPANGGTTISAHIPVGTE